MRTCIEQTENQEQSYRMIVCHCATVPGSRNITCDVITRPLGSRYSTVHVPHSVTEGPELQARADGTLILSKV